MYELRPIIVDLKYECNAGKSAKSPSQLFTRPPCQRCGRFGDSEPSEDNADKGSHRWWGRLASTRSSSPVVTRAGEMVEAQSDIPF